MRPKYEELEERAVLTRVRINRRLDLIDNYITDGVKAEDLRQDHMEVARLTRLYVRQSVAAREAKAAWIGSLPRKLDD